MTQAKTLPGIWKEIQELSWIPLRAMGLQMPAGFTHMDKEDENSSTVSEEEQATLQWKIAELPAWKQMGHFLLINWKLTDQHNSRNSDITTERNTKELIERVCNGTTEKSIP